MICSHHVNDLFSRKYMCVITLNCAVQQNFYTLWGFSSNRRKEQFQRQDLRKCITKSALALFQHSSPRPLVRCWFDHSYLYTAGWVFDCKSLTSFDAGLGDLSAGFQEVFPKMLNLRIYLPGRKLTSGRPKRNEIAAQNTCPKTGFSGPLLRHVPVLGHFFPRFSR